MTQALKNQDDLRLAREMAGSILDVLTENKASDNVAANALSMALAACLSREGADRARCQQLFDQVMRHVGASVDK